MTLSASGVEKASGVTEKIALELAFAQAGQDEGLLPINSLLSELVETVPDGWPAPFAEALTRARAWVDQALEAGRFETQGLRQLGDWVKWMQAALAAAKSGHEPPPLPIAAGEASVPTAVPDDRGGPLPAAPQPSADGPGTENILLNLESDRELLREFIAESREHLQEVEQGVLVLEQNPAERETLHAIFRAFHSFKGGSGFLNLMPINRLTHELESLLDRARQGNLTVTSEVIDLILAAGDALKRCLAAMEAQVAGLQPAAAIPLAIAPMLARVRALLDGRQASKQVETGPAAAPVPGSAAAPAESAGAGVSAGPKPPTGMVKVDTRKLDALVDLVGEMVIAQSLVVSDTDIRGLESSPLRRHLAQLSRITAELQRAAMSMRMVPIRGTFQKMTRLVRDLSLKAGKQIDLAITGEETELDRNLTEELDAPLVHMIRNAVDHGLEKPDARVAAGKPPRGTIHLRAFHQGGNIVIEVADDGAGLNRDRILAKAIEKRLVRPDEDLSESDIINLIFAPGFSTAEVVTDISGRGVGMDVVRRNIGNLRGKIEVRSTPGHGSVFTILVPLTLAIIDGLLVSVGGQRFILPTLAVRESFRPAPGSIMTLQGRGEMVKVRGRLCPLLRLSDHFHLESSVRDPTDGIIVVLESNHENRGLLVDQLLGKQEVVIKSLGELFKPNRALAGAAILGDGRVGLILDVHALVQLQASGLARAA